MDVYTLEAGRAIRRNGHPFVSLAGCSRESPAYAPADFDTFARFVVAAGPALDALLGCPDLNLESLEPETLRAIDRGREALALLPKQEG